MNFLVYEGNEFLKKRCIQKIKISRRLHVRKLMALMVAFFLVSAAGSGWAKDNSTRQNFVVNAKIHIQAMFTAKNHAQGPVKQVILEAVNLLTEPGFGKMSEAQKAALDFVRSHGKELKVKLHCPPAQLGILRSYIPAGQCSWEGDLATDARLRVVISGKDNRVYAYLLDHKLALASGVPAIPNTHLLVARADKAAHATKSASTASWIAKIKTRFEESGEQALTEIDRQELPAPAGDQWNTYNKTYGPEYPPTASKLTIDDQTAFFVMECNDGEMYVDVFDTAGKRIAAGSCTESSDFRWDTIGRGKLFQAAASDTAAQIQMSVSTTRREGNDAVDPAWVAKVKEYYEENGEDDLTPIKREDLPAKAKKAFDRFNKEWGPDYPPNAYTYLIDGKAAFFVQENTDGGWFVEVFDDAGHKLCSGSCSESGEFDWDV